MAKNKVRKEVSEQEVSDAAEKIYKGLIDGYDEETLCASNQIYGDLKRKALQSARKRFMVFLNNAPEEDKAQILGMYYDLFSKSKQIGNYKLCKGILDSIAEIKNVKENTVVLKQTFEVDWS